MINVLYRASSMRNPRTGTMQVGRRQVTGLVWSLYQRVTSLPELPAVDLFCSGILLL